MSTTRAAEEARGDVLGRAAPPPGKAAPPPGRAAPLPGRKANDLNVKLWKAAKDGDYDAVVSAMFAGADKNWKSPVSDNDM